MILLLVLLLASCSSAPHSQPASTPIQWDEPQSPAPATKADTQQPTETEKREYVKNKLGQAQDELNRALKKGQ